MAFDVIHGGVTQPGCAMNAFSRLLGSPAVGAATAIHAAVTDTGVLITVTTAITNPDVPRNVTATPGGTTANVTAVAVIVTGTDREDAVLVETLPVFTAGQATAVVGSKAFKTVTSIAIPANGSAVTTAIGTGAKLGLTRRLTRNTVFAAYLNGVKEATAPTVVFDSAVLPANMVTLSSTLNGNPVIVDFFDN